MQHGHQRIIANRLKNDYILCPDMRQRSIAGCYQNNVAWLYHLRSSGERYLYLCIVEPLVLVVCQVMYNNENVAQARFGNSALG
ncbi:hypothetical protein [Symbiopectobacterium purcellii]|uniref:hypothetical protein n=1 Tax=Symbiopectobacterium purcellii TaxID=2871826 RepID=UPI003F8428F7